MSTPNIVPQADNEGSLGTSAKKWADVQAVKLNGKELTTVAKADAIPVTKPDGKIDATLLGSHTHAQSDVTNLSTALAGKSDTTHNHSGTYVEPARSITAGNGLTGGGDLSANRTITLGTPASCSPATSNAATAESHTHAITGVAASSHTHSDYVPTGRTVTAGNGLSGGGALSANITVTMGTPGSCSTSTSNAVTATSHTHAITGVAAASHTHSYVPIATSYALPVGTLCVCYYIHSTGSVPNNGTTSGSNLKVESISADMYPAQTGTWKNISGVTIYGNKAPAIGAFVRIA
jgi:hypothetical protein